MPFYSYAQNAYEVKGLVFDEVGPMIGASVLEKGTSNGTATGSDGDYVLAVSSAEAIVEISSIGYKTVSFKASEIPAKVYLEVDSQMLEETVVVGYGSLSKKEVSSLPCRILSFHVPPMRPIWGPIWASSTSPSPSRRSSWG